MSKELIEIELKTKLIHEGMLLKRSKFLRQWRERWVVLTGSYVITFANKNCQEITDVIDLNSVKSIKSYLTSQQEMIPVGFKIRSADNELYLCAKDTAEKWTWIVAIERLMHYRNAASNDDVNCLQYATEKGFPSVKEYLGILKGEKKEVLDVQEIKKQIEQQSIEMMKDIIKQQDNVRKERDHLKKEKEDMVILREKYQSLQEEVLQLTKCNEKLQKAKDLQRKGKDKSVQPQILPNKNNSFKVSRQSKEQQLKIYRSHMINCIFEEFIEQCNAADNCKYLITFLMTITAHQNYGYLQPFAVALKTHDNKFNFVETLFEVLDKEGDLIQDDYEKTISFMGKIVDINPSILSFQQLDVLRRMILQIIKAHPLYHVDKTLRLIALLNEIDPIKDHQIRQWVLSNVVREGSTLQILKLVKQMQEQ